MHELSIAASIVDAVSMEMNRQNLPSVHAIVVRVGALSGVDPEALRFGFAAITAETPLAKTRLEIEHVPVLGKCRTCNYEFSVKDYIFACPACQSGQIEVTHGEELDIAYLEVDERQEA
jgi:hydrogenase nickel incorporation protein HypA/HybF